MDTIAQALSEYDFAGINKNIPTDKPDFTTTVKLQLTPKSLIDSISANLNVKQIINNACFNETVNTIYKELNSKISITTPTIEINTDGDNLHSILADNIKNGYVITNGLCGATIQDMPEFTSEPITNFMHIYGVYKIGTFNEVDIFVDPYMAWNNTKLYNILEPYFNYSAIVKPETEIVNYIGSIIYNNTQESIDICEISIKYSEIAVNVISVEYINS